MEVIIRYGLLAVFLGLCLIEGFHAWLTLTPITKPISLDGAAVAIPDLLWQGGECFPESNWKISAWVYIEADR